MKTFLILALSASSSFFLRAHANSDLPEDVSNDIIEGKIQAAENIWLVDLNLDLNRKEEKALHLIGRLANILNKEDGFSSEKKKEEIQFSHMEFVARFQSIHNSREALRKKGTLPDYGALQDYSRRLNLLILDLQRFLK